MQKINYTLELKDAIQKLQDQQYIEAQLIKERLRNTYENLSPPNLIKTLAETTLLPGIAGNLIGITLGLTTGYLSKVLRSGKSVSIFKKVLGSLLVLGVTGIMARRGEVRNAFGRFIFQKFMSKK